MPTNAQAFAADIGAQALRVSSDALELKQRVALELAQGVVLGTPVDQGFARGGWQATNGSPAAGDRENADPSGGSALREAAAVVGRATLETTWYLTNNRPYILRLEFEGWSQQAPNGWVRAHAERVRAKYAATG